MAISVCYCHAYEDKALFNKLRKHLEPMKSSGIITTWHDDNIPPGMESDKEITKQMVSADILLILASANFVSSRYYGPNYMKSLKVARQSP